MINLSISLKFHEFSELRQKISPSLVFFFLILGVIVCSIIGFLVSKKYSVAIEYVIPAYGVFVCLFCLPTWIEDYRKPKFIAGATLLQANNFVYILNGVLIFFYCSHYSISTAGRQLLTLNNLNMAFKRWTSGDAQLLPVLYNFFLCTVFFEIHCYNMNREKVKLFLKKEKCK